MSDAVRPSRRVVLLGLLAVPLAACRGHHPGVRHRSAADPDAPALTAALAAERGLLADYDRARSARASAGGTPFDLFRATHAAHVQALESALNLPAASPSTGAPPTSTAPTSTAPSGPSLRGREADTGRSLTTWALGARQGKTAALLASIGAVHLAQSHLRFHRSGGPT
jgi:hypothetical protein